MQVDLNIVLMIISAGISAGISWGISQTKVRKLEDEVIALRVGANKDRDLLIEIKTKVDMLLDGKIFPKE